ncbi:hypothetical protein Syun_019710 [Stephania yunnanensis]|uniref:Uncharacterized protein n=1 Tax=Stephania yunnanensis TaxID=152371 RepID=A0AAP0NWX3_9MAGN
MNGAGSPKNNNPIKIYLARGRDDGGEEIIGLLQFKGKDTHKKTRIPFGLYVKLVRREEPLVMMIKFFPAFSCHASCKHRILQQVDNVELVPQEVTRGSLELVPQEVTGGSFGGKDYQSSNNVMSQEQQQEHKHHEQQLHHMELVPHHHDLPPEFWVNHHDNSSLEVFQETTPTGRIGSLLLPDQLDDNSTDDEEVGDDQDWIENLESTLEVHDEEQQPCI